MCKQGTMDIFTIPSGAKEAYYGKKEICVDHCISRLVKVLNDNGFATRASCCGHGHSPGSIALANGCELIIAPDFESARIAEKAFPDIQGNWSTREGKALSRQVKKWLKS